MIVPNPYHFASADAGRLSRGVLGVIGPAWLR
jgi:hypothetical protein